MQFNSTQIDRRIFLGRETILEEYPPASRRAPFIAVAYPSAYRTGMSNLGFHFLLRSMRKGGARVERVFTDTAPLTLESGLQLASASAILFSVSYEEDYINLIRMLLVSGIAPERRERNGKPVIVAGGAAVSANPVPMAGVVDAFCLGEGEGPIEAIAEALRGTEGIDRRRAIDQLAGVKGMLIPDRGGRFAEMTAEIDFPRSMIITPNTVFPDTLLIESGRGCPGACNFCLATSLYRPFRAVSVEAVEVYLSAHAAVIPRVGLVSTAVAAHPHFERLVEMFLDRGIAVSFSSLRAEDIDPRKARLIARAGARSVTLAPESGSEELRFRLGKRVRDESYIGAAEMLSAAGVKSIGLYLMIGCPGETDESVEHTRIFLSHIASAIGGARLSVHVNPLIPKPWTPLQYYGMAGERELEKRQLAIRTICRELGIRVRMKSIRSSLRQATISLGDERVGNAILRFASGRISWKRALDSEGVDRAYPHEEKGERGPFPWDGLGGPIRPEILYRRYRRMIGQ